MTFVFLSRGALTNSPFDTASSLRKKCCKVMSPSSSLGRSFWCLFPDPCRRPCSTTPFCWSVIQDNNVFGPFFVLLHNDGRKTARPSPSGPPPPCRHLTAKSFPPPSPRWRAAPPQWAAALSGPLWASAAGCPPRRLGPWRGTSRRTAPSAAAGRTRARINAPHLSTSNLRDTHVQFGQRLSPLVAG